MADAVVHADDVSPARSPTAAVEGDSPRANIRLVIADRDEALLNSYQGSLSQDGFDVRTATDVRQCVAALEGWGPDVLVLDPDVPSVSHDDALTFLSRLWQENDAGILLPVMVLTWASEALDPDGTPFRIRGQQFKPVPPDRLGRRLRSLLGIASPGTGGGRPSAGRSGRPTYFPGAGSRMAGVIRLGGDGAGAGPFAPPGSGMGLRAWHGECGQGVLPDDRTEHPGEAPRGA